MLAIKKIFNLKTLYGFMFFTMAASAVYAGVRLIYAPAIRPAHSDVSVRVKSDYFLILLSCIMGVVALLIPGILRRIVRIDIPSIMMIVYAVFLYCSIYLGEVRNFYYSVPHWDTILHTFSGAALGALGFSLVSILNKSESIPFDLSPFFVALFAFCFAITLGVVWEIYEFVMDYFFGTNMQKFAFESGELLIGQEALLDTMKDLIVDALGALTMSVIGFISLKYEKGWLDRFQIETSYNDGA